jgi:hypothetical protein
MIKRLFAIFASSEATFQGKEAGEHVVMILRRHVFSMGGAAVLVFLAALVPILVRLAFADGIAERGWGALYLFLASLWYAGLWLLSFYFLTLYALNTVIITDRRIIENEQLGFFDRKVSELHLYRIQDVSTRIEGAIPTFFSFGAVSVQTASAEREFIFEEIPHPERVKDAVMRLIATKRDAAEPPLPS